jgi:hypothetical protein
MKVSAQIFTFALNRGERSASRPGTGERAPGIHSVEALTDTNKQTNSVALNPRANYTD